MRQYGLNIIAQVQTILSEYDYAITLRQLYYQLVARQIFENIENNYRKLSRVCVQGRDEGLLDEDKFADNLRKPDVPGVWADISAFMKTVRRAYRRDYWQQQPHYIEIWAEKDALRSVMSIAGDYGVTLQIVRGQASRTAISEAAYRYQEHSDKELYLHYFGDHDPSGYCIYNSIKERLTIQSGLNISYSREALKTVQVQEYNLPSDPAKQSDPNYKRFAKEYGNAVVELDALRPNILRGMVSDCILNHIEDDAWQKSERQEIQEQEWLKTLEPRALQ